MRDLNLEPSWVMSTPNMDERRAPGEKFKPSLPVWVETETYKRVRVHLIGRPSEFDQNCRAPNAGDR
jgi:hypothetical protein